LENKLDLDSFLFGEEHLFNNRKTNV